MRIWLVVLAGVVALAMAVGADTRAPFRFMTLDPGHFHAGLVQKEMYPDVSPTVDVYAPEGPDLDGAPQADRRVQRPQGRPTSWVLEVHKGPDALDRMLRERPGNVVVISGQEQGQDRAHRPIRRRQPARAGRQAVDPDARPICPRLEAALADADRKRVVAYDIMTERFEITSILQRALVNDPAVYGEQLKGTPDDPAVYMESVHHLMKVVSGAPNIRPAWFFDTDEQGEGLNDIGTHLVDLVQWTLFPDQPIDYRADVKVLSAYRWPTMIPEAEFKRVTASEGFPASLAPRVKGGAAGVLLQHLRHLYRQGRPRRAQRAVGLGSAGRRRRHPLRGLQGIAREGRGAAVEGRQLPHRGVRRAQRGAPTARRCWPP